MPEMKLWAILVEHADGIEFYRDNGKVWVTPDLEYAHRKAYDHERLFAFGLRIRVNTKVVPYVDRLEDATTQWMG